jgi:hypothetical protein
MRQNYTRTFSFWQGIFILAFFLRGRRVSIHYQSPCFISIFKLLDFATVQP